MQPILRIDRNPFSLLLIFLATTGGITRLLSHTPPSILEGKIPPILLYLWFVLLAIGGVITFIGVGWRDLLTGVIIERVGIWLWIGGAILYSSILCIYGGWAGVGGATYTYAFAVVAIWRVMQINKDLRLIREKQ